MIGSSLLALILSSVPPASCGNDWSLTVRPLATSRTELRGSLVVRITNESSSPRTLCSWDLAYAGFTGPAAKKLSLGISSSPEPSCGGHSLRIAPGGGFSFFARPWQLRGAASTRARRIVLGLSLVEPSSDDAPRAVPLRSCLVEAETASSARPIPVACAKEAETTAFLVEHDKSAAVSWIRVDNAGKRSQCISWPSSSRAEAASSSCDLEERLLLPAATAATFRVIGKPPEIFVTQFESVASCQHRLVRVPVVHHP